VIKSNRTVAYLRMSSEKQDTSIQNQRQQIAAAGHKIDHEYIDEGISGLKDDRSAFQEMLADAEAGKIAAVVVIAADRFARAEPMTAMGHCQRLQAAGVKLISLAEPHLTLEGRHAWILVGMTFMGANEYVRSLAHKTQMGKLRKALEGEWSFGKVPFGYQVNDQRRLEPTADAAVVQRIFREYIDGLSAARIAIGLNTDGVATYSGRPWNNDDILRVLRNATYTGDIHIGKQRSAKFFTISGNRIAEVEGRQKYHRKEAEIVVENSHTPIIDRETFQAVQELRESRRRIRPRKDARRRRVYPLSGLVKCCRCGRSLSAYTTRHNRIRMSCSNSNTGDGRCDGIQVGHDQILRPLAEVCRQLVNDKTVRKLAEAEIRRLTTEQAAEDTSAAGVHQEQLRKAQRQLAKSEANLLKLDQDMIAIGQNHIRELRAEVERLEQLCRPAETVDHSETFERAMEAFARVPELVETGDPVAVNDLLRGLFGGIVAHVESVPAGPRRRHILQSVEILAHSQTRSSSIRKQHLTTPVAALLTQLVNERLQGCTTSTSAG